MDDVVKAAWKSSWVIACGLGAGCAVSSGEVSAFDGQALLSMSETQRASRSPTSPELAEGVLPERLRRSLSMIETTDPRFEVANRALAEVVNESAYKPERPEAVAAEASERARALRLYVSGRQKLLDGRFIEAEADLAAATALDPSAAEPWRELGEARLARGERGGVIEALLNAVDRGDQHPRTKLLLAGELVQAGRAAEAMAHLALAAQADLRSMDPALRPLIMANLGTLLGQFGHERALLEATEAALAPLDASVMRSQYRRELSDLLQRAPSLWADAGDSACRLGEFARAVDAYARAESAPRPGSEPMTDRRVYALLRDGRPAEAALTVVQAASSVQRSMDERLIDLVAALRMARPDLAPGVGGELDSAVRAAAHASGPSFHSWATRLASAAAPEPEARVTLGAAMAHSPADRELALAWVRTFHARPMPEILDAGASIIRQTPESAMTIAWAVAAQRDDAIERMGTDMADPVALGVLSACLALERGQAQDALARIEALPRRGRDSALTSQADAARVRALAALGEFAEAEAALTDLGRAAQGSPALLSALLSLQQFGPAAALAAQKAEASQGLEETPWRRAEAEIAIAQGNGAAAVAALHRVTEIDPFDASSAVVLLQALQPRGLAPDASRLGQVGVRLRETLTCSTPVRRIVVVEFLQRGLDAMAEAQSVALADERPFDDAAIQLLAQTYQTLEQRQPGSAERGLRWLDRQLAARPNHAAAVVARARLLARLGRAQEAVDALAAAIGDAAPPNRALHPLLAQTHEDVLADALDRDDEAASLRRARLLAAPPSIDSTLDLAGAHAAMLDPASVVSMLARLPAATELTVSQRMEVASIVGASAPAAARNQTGDEALAWLSIVDWAIDRKCTLPASAHSLRLVLLALKSPPDVAAVLKGLDLATTQVPGDASGLRYSPIRSLLDAGRASDAVVLLAALHTSDPVPQPGIYVAWMRLAAQAGTDDDVRRVANAAPQGEPASAALREFGDEERLSSREVNPRAELIYRLAALLNGMGRDDLADEMYRRVLELDPTNPWACNDYGYRLAERGERLAEAEVLLEHAHRALPNRHSVIDSLGWVRYRRGELADDVDEAGVVLREGAVTLLTRAVDLAGEDASAEALEHLGDALWKVGRANDAKGAWDRALTQAERDAGETNAPGFPENLKRRVEGRLASVRARLEALATGADPPVAEILAGG